MNTPKINKLLNLAISFAVLVVSYLFLYYQLTNKEGLSQTWDMMRQGIPPADLALTLACMLLMMLLNWSLEALKWRYLIRKTERIGFFTAFRAVWAGITVSTFTPNRMGEYFGRVFLLKSTHPWKGVFMTVVGSLSQLLVTILFGTIAFIAFTYNFFPFTDYIPESLFWIIAAVFILLDLMMVILYFNVKLFEPILKRFTLKRWTKLREHLRIFGAYSTKELAVVLLFSCARYLVFSLQFYVLLRLFMIPVPLVDGLMITASIYLLMAAVPTVALTELGVRGSLALFFFDLYYANNYLIGDTASLGAVSAASLIWIINLVVPALLGGLFVLQLKFFRK